MEQKKNLVRDITECLVRTLNLTPEQRNHCTVHFDVINPENIAVGGSLISENKKACNHLEAMAPNLQQEQIERLGRELHHPGGQATSSLTDEQIHQFGIQFQQADLNRMFMGGQAMSQPAARR